MSLVTMQPPFFVNVYLNPFGQTWAGVPWSTRGGSDKGARNIQQRRNSRVRVTSFKVGVRP